MPIQADIEFAEVEIAPTLAVLVPGECSAEPSSITNAIAAAFDTLMGYVGRHGLIPIAPPRTIYTAYGEQRVEFRVAMPILRPHPVPEAEPQAAIETIRGAKAYRFTHRGPYSRLMQTYGQITVFLKERGWLQSEADWEKYMPMWEEYLNDPESTPEADLLTYIYLPIT